MQLGQSILTPFCSLLALVNSLPSDKLATDLLSFIEKMVERFSYYFIYYWVRSAVSH